MTVHYRSLSPDRPEWLGGGQWILENLSDVTILFGRNSSGKSILLRELMDIHPDATHYTSPERAGTITYDQNIMNQELNPSSRGSQRKGKNQALQFRQETVSRIGTLKMKIGDRTGRGESIKPIYDYIEESVVILLPDFVFSITDASPPYELSRYRTGNSSLEIVQPDQLSSGEAEVLTLALDLLTICNIWVIEDRRQRLLLVDEPDTHLHPDLQVRLAQFLIQLLDKFDAQLIVATHSTTLLSSIGHYGKENVGVIYLNNSQSEQKVTQFSKVLRELSTVLGGHALMGPLFGAPILLVEGDDDYKIWSQVPRHPAFRGSLAVIPCDGDEIYDYQAKLESLFASIREDGESHAGYALLDGDSRLPTNSPEEHVKFLRLGCREAENLYLSAECLNSMGLTWAQAQSEIAAKADTYLSHAAKLRTCEIWDRPNEDIKEVINSLADILDDKKVPWTLRVGKAIGERPPVGELAEFLGDEVVEAFWANRRRN